MQLLIEKITVDYDLLHDLWTGKISSTWEQYKLSLEFFNKCTMFPTLLKNPELVGW